jgi:hypothetical protein
MRVKCIDAEEDFIPIKEGQVYTVQSSFSEVPEWDRGGKAVGGYHLVEVKGRYRQDRFTIVEPD